MKENTDPQRNRPAETGENKDPGLRGASGSQPGTNTMSPGSSDQANEEITKVNSGNFGDSLEEDDADEEFETGGGD